MRYGIRDGQPAVWLSRDAHASVGPVKRFLRTPSGWIAVLLVECAVLLVLAKGLVRVFPDSPAAVYRLVLGCAVVLVFGNYLFRRRYLR
jgi:hypothetical protein